MAKRSIYSKKLMILDVGGLRVPTAAEKTQIAKQWAKSTQKKRGKSKSDYTFDVTTGGFVTKSTAASKSIKLLQQHIKKLAAENRRLRENERQMRARMQEIERELEEREAQGAAASYTSEGYDQEAAEDIKYHHFEGVGGYETREDTQRAADEFRDLLQDLSLQLGQLRMLYYDAGFPEDEPFGAAIDYDNLYARFKGLTDVWNSLPDKVHGSPEELAIREFLYNNKDTLEELKDSVSEAIREGRKWISSHQ